MNAFKYLRCGVLDTSIRSRLKFINFFAQKTAHSEQIIRLFGIETVLKSLFQTLHKLKNNKIFI